MKKRKINTAIAGLGRSGWAIHCRLFEPLLDTQYRITAVFDKDSRRCSEAEDRFGCRSYKSYPAMLRDKDVEIVVVATPSHFHTTHTIRALEAEKHVVCEKPMATCLKDADSMIASAKKNKRKLFIFQNNRYDPIFLKVKQIIDSGVLGRIVQIRIAYHSFSRRWDWQTLKKNGGGNLNNTGPHPIDQALVLFGEGTPKVFCVRDKALTLGDADDHVKLILYGKNKPVIEVEISSACAYPQDRWLVMGTQGTLTGSPTGVKWKYFNPKSLPKREVDEHPTPDRGYNRENLKMTEKSWDASKTKNPGEYGFYPDVYRSIIDDKPMYISPESVRRQIWVMDECRKLAPV